MEKSVDGDIREDLHAILPNEADLKNWDKHWKKSKDAQKLLNTFILSQRERERYYQEFGKFPEEFPDGSEGQLEWTYPRTKESKQYVKELTERNPTHSAKRPSRSKKEVTPPKVREPWRPPPH